MNKRQEMLPMNRPVSSHQPMDRQRRAKQFAPFQALKGFEHSIQEKEFLFVERKLQPDSIRINLDQKIRSLPKGTSVTVLYYMESTIKPGYGTYVSIYGIPRFLPHLRILEICKQEIPFDDILDIIPSTTLQSDFTEKQIKVPPDFPLDI